VRPKDSQGDSLVAKEKEGTTTAAAAVEAARLASHLKAAGDSAEAKRAAEIALRPLAA
jgi:hypothetical protein